MTTVKHVLDQKGHDVQFIHPDATVFDALKKIAENNIGSLVVLDDGKLVGVITERHYAREIVLRGRTSRERWYGTLCRPNRLAHDATSSRGPYGCDNGKSVRHPPVIESERLVGIVSIGYMVKSVIGDQKFIIEQLEDFIHGDR